METNLNCDRKMILKVFIKASIFLSGIAILIWQVQGTFETFIKNRTSFEVRKDPFDSLVPPTIIICPKVLKAGDNLDLFANISNKDHHQIYELLDK